MRKPKQKPARKSWIDLSSPLKAESVAGVYSATYSLQELTQRGAIKDEAFDSFKRITKLADLSWRALWTRGAVAKAGGRENFLRKAREVIIFVHGWDGSNAIWENLPAHVCAAENDCLILAPDVNGFGGSPFAHPERLTPDQCSPQANMRALEKWLSTLKLLGARREYPTVFVGHSMGGATLFYLNERLLSGRTVGRYAVAPALLLNDLTKKSFYRTLGAGIFAGNLLALDKLQNQIAPFVINQLIAGASKAVQAEHKRIFKKTHKQTIARTFDAMGQAKKPSHGREWNRFRVILGHSDRLVGLTPMLDLLAALGFTSRQVRVALGDHYFFSVSKSSQPLHAANREIMLEDIRELVSESVKG